MTGLQPEASEATTPERDLAKSREYWRANLRVLATLLGIWFVAAFLPGIVWVEPLNALRVAGFPLGFWFAQQGGIVVFVLLCLVYALWMDRLERRMQD